MEQKVREIMADILQLDPDAIEGSTSHDNTATWDSLNHINLITALEQEFGTTFDVGEIESMLSFDDILNVLAAKQVH
jgi:acyl carrier protein